MPGALRCGFHVYRMFEADGVWNREWRERNGKVRVRSLVLSGEHVFMTAGALEMACEMYDNVEQGIVEGSGHWLAEENPEGFVEKVLAFVEKR